MRPSKLLCSFILLDLLVSFLGFFWQLPSILWMVALAWLALVLADAWLAWRIPSPTCNRSCPTIIPLGQNSEVTLEFHNSHSYSLAVQIYDHLPDNVHCEVMPLKLELASREKEKFTYKIKALKRGRLKFRDLSISFASPFGLWIFQRQISTEIRETKVYPDYASLLNNGIKHIEASLTQMGVRQRRKRGEGTDFRELREFRQGDKLGSIDWKATARIQKIITRQYQEDRDQQVVFLLDCGRRMKSSDGELSHFDHALNSMILLSYVAIQHGDAVGLMTFSGQEIYLPPEKKDASVNRIIDRLFDVYPSLQPADYIQAAERCLTMIKKRSLIVVISNVDEDESEMQKAIRLLGTKHEVLFAALRENVLDENLVDEAQDEKRALLQAGICHHLIERRDQLQKINLTKRCHLLDIKASALAMSLAGKYKELKSSGII